MTNSVPIYIIYRGKCKEACEALQKVIPELELVRGHYFDCVWNSNEAHWWLVDSDGNIVDPTANQFPTKGKMTDMYVPFNGIISCEQCGKSTKEEDAIIMGNGHYAVCSNSCAQKLVGC